MRCLLQHRSAACLKDLGCRGQPTAEHHGWHLREANLAGESTSLLRCPHAAKLPEPLSSCLLQLFKYKTSVSLALGPEEPLLKLI
mmetsp:Transcript_23604/g.43869  ORF Transcript_23604/g.43869 Transcript_23604/m.43869 type:complete len:85 (+) Transcript_23604:209-463(+)